MTWLRITCAIAIAAFLGLLAQLIASMPEPGLARVIWRWLQ
jgi:hypothetical protein